MERNIPLMSPNITDDDIKQVVDVLKSGMLVQGRQVLELEGEFRKYLSAAHASAVSNGTATLHMALLILGVGKGDEVIVPAFSYMATANVVELVGARPVFVDINIDTFNIDNTLISKHITPHTKAIIPVHEFGLAAEISAIVQLASEKGIYVIEDAACALGAKENERFVGTFGHFGSFSLHPRKAISSGEGGVLVTNSEQLDKRVKILRNHGIDTIDGAMQFVEPGYNYRMTDFQAALVKNQLKRLNEIIDYKQQLSAIYMKHLDSSKLKLPSIPSNKNHTWQTFHVLLNDDFDRDKVIAKLKEKGIGTNYGAQCMPYMKVFQDKYHLDCRALFPNAMRAYEKGLALPIYEKLNAEDVLYISETLNQILD